MSKRLIHVLALFTLLSSAAGQQLSAPPPTAAESKAELELNKKAEGLLTEVTRHARGLKNKENQVLVRIAVGDLLWKSHETTARTLFKEGAEILRQAMISQDDSLPEAAENDRSLFQLRQRFFSSLGRHDPMMARDLLRGDLRLNPVDTTRADTDPPGETASAPDSPSDVGLELSFATKMVDTNPKEALRAAREALSKGFPAELGLLLPRLAEKEPKLAQEFAVEIVNKLRKANFESDYEAAGLATTLANELMSSQRIRAGETQTEKRTPLLTPEASKEFIQFLAEAALKKTSGGSSSILFMSLTLMMEDLERFAPDQASQLKAILSATEIPEPTESIPYFRFQRLALANDTKGMLEMAASAPLEVRDSLYSQIATVTWQQGDRAKANEIIATKISDPIERIRVLTEFQEQTVRGLIEKQEFIQARQLITQNRSTDRRVRQLIELAEATLDRGNKITALEIVQEAQSLMGVKARKERELEAQFKIAGALSEIDPGRSFAILGPAIDQVNELMMATALIANFGRSSGMFKDDEFVLDSTIAFGFSSLSARNISALARFDFNRTKELLERFQRPETRITAYLMMSGSILEPPPARGDCTCSERSQQLKTEAADKVEP